MSKSTAAVIMVSPAALPPWGDDGWRFSGAMQLVHDGPDWLYAQWPVLGGTEHHGSERFAILALREDPTQRASDIAAMTFALLQVPEWRQLTSWWGLPEAREELEATLGGIVREYADEYKLAVVQTGAGVPGDVLQALRDLGFEVVEFGQTGRTAQD